VVRPGGASGAAAVARRLTCGRSSRDGTQLDGGAAAAMIHGGIQPGGRWRNLTEPLDRGVGGGTGERHPCGGLSRGVSRGDHWAQRWRARRKWAAVSWRRLDGRGAGKPRGGAGQARGRACGRVGMGARAGARALAGSHGGLGRREGRSHSSLTRRSEAR